VHGRPLAKRTHEYAEQGLIVLHRLPQADLGCAAGITNEHEAALGGKC
jgi:hypothetical protein